MGPSATAHEANAERKTTSSRRAGDATRAVHVFPSRSIVCTQLCDPPSYFFFFIIIFFFPSRRHCSSNDAAPSRRTRGRHLRAELFSPRFTSAVTKNGRVEFDSLSLLTRRTSLESSLLAVQIKCREKCVSHISGRIVFLIPLGLFVALAWCLGSPR